MNSRQVVSIPRFVPPLIIQLGTGNLPNEKATGLIHWNHNEKVATVSFGRQTILIELKRNNSFTFIKLRNAQLFSQLDIAPVRPFSHPILIFSATRTRKTWPQLGMG